MNEQVKVGGKLKLRLWDQACKRLIESRVEKGIVRIVHVLSGWLASFYLVRRVLLKHISRRISVKSAINKRKSSCHFTWRNGSIAAWMFVHPTNMAEILNLKGLLINQKLFLSTSEYHYYFQGRKWNMPDFWNRHDHSFSKVCFLAIVLFVAFPILLQQLQEKTSRKKNSLCFQRNAKH